MSQLVGEVLHHVGRQTTLVVDDVVGRRVDGALPDGQRHQEEVVSLRKRLEESRNKILTKH